MKFSLLVIGTLLCVLYFDIGYAAPELSANPASLAHSQPKTVTAVVNENKAPTNNSVIVIDHSRVKRSCRRNEHWTHRCRSDCECAGHRYCSSYGYCHERNRQRREGEEDYNEPEEIGEEE